MHTTAMIAASLFLAAVIWLLIVFGRWVQLHGKKPFRAIVGEASLLFLAAVGLILAMMAYTVPVGGWIDDFAQGHGLNEVDARMMHEVAKYLLMLLFFAAAIFGPILWRKFRRVRRRLDRPLEDFHSSSRSH